jgi:hypothetical protein
MPFASDCEQLRAIASNSGIGRRIKLVVTALTSWRQVARSFSGLPSTMPLCETSVWDGRLTWMVAGDASSLCSHRD